MNQIHLTFTFGKASVPPLWVLVTSNFTQFDLSFHLESVELPASFKQNPLQLSFAYKSLRSNLVRSQWDFKITFNVANLLIDTSHDGQRSRARPQSSTVLQQSHKNSQEPRCGPLARGKHRCQWQNPSP